MLWIVTQLIASLSYDEIGKLESTQEARVLNLQQLLSCLWPLKNKLDKLQSRERRSCLIERWNSMEI